eukprot:CAMPEP_0204915540 /NCGR_PEP_ID=MMETSP1397-20131031/13514_1 /ASSEMBLY_ACC=CAM_ASM_000891 /TAXON_ID=49980 /ORGANISM="Climacostomum Climacostomum virens, Strain Stock W-24" /LENGTH=236 /DNA_ID=CAMNT_0052087617 /DNA_START=17 /DNA_END=724 /DNA_ORIENTATION=+
MSQDIDNIFPRHSRIAHLEDNHYLYGDVPPNLHQGSPRQHAEESMSRRIPPNEDQMLRTSLAYSRSANSLDLQSQRDYEEEEYLRRQEEHMRRQDFRNALHLSTSDLENRISEQERLRSMREADRRTHLLSITPVKSITPKTQKSKKRRTSQRASRKSSQHDSRFSKYNTKSPYNKPTFSYLVKTIDNQKYTYESTKKPRRASVKRDFFSDLLELAEAHAGQCANFREKFLKIKQR